MMEILTYASLFPPSDPASYNQMDSAMYAWESLQNNRRELIQLD